MTTEAPKPKRINSTKQLMDSISELIPNEDALDKQKLKPYDPATAAQARENLARSLDKLLDEQFFIEELVCAGNINLLCISEFPILEEATEAIGAAFESLEEDERRGYVEIRMHRWTQKTFAYQSENSKAAWAVMTLVGTYKHWELGKKKLRLMGISRAKLTISPIVFINFSDGKAEIQDDTFRSSFDAPVLNIGTVEKARAAYSYTLFETLMSENEELTSEVKRLEKQDADREKNTEKRIKKWVARINRDTRRAGEFDQSGIGGMVVRLMSNNAVKMIFWLMALFGLYIVIAMVVFALTGVQLPTPFTTPDSTIPTDGPVPYVPP